MKWTEAKTKQQTLGHLEDNTFIIVQTVLLNLHNFSLFGDLNFISILENLDVFNSLIYWQ